MRVLLIAGEYPPYMFGGGATFMYYLSRGLASRGMDVTVISMKFSKRFERKFDVEERGSRLRILRVSVPSYLYPRHEVFQVVAKPLVAELLKEHDVVHINTGLYYPFLRDVIKKSEKPTIVTVHGDPILVYKVSLKLSRLPMETVYGLLHMSEAHVALKKELTELYPVFVSKSLYETMKTKYKITRYSIIYNGVDYEYVDRALASDPKTGFYNIVMNAKMRGYKILVYHARLYPIKNHVMLIRIANILKKRYGLRFLVVFTSDGIMKSSIIKLASKLGILNHVLITGRLPYDETLRILAQADAIPYVSLYEAHPVALIEGLYLGKHIVSFNLPYAREISSMCASLNNYCLIKLVSTVEDFIKELLDIIQKSSNCGKVTIKYFDASYMVDSYVKLYEKIHEEANSKA